MSGRHWAGGIGLTVVAALVVLITLTPSTVDSGYQAEIAWLLEAMHRRGVPGWFQYRQLEFTANVVMFVPLGFFAGLLLGRRWWRWLWLPVAVSALIELWQYLFLPGRVAALSDVIANSMGGIAGLVFAGVVLAVAGAMRGSKAGQH